MAETTHGESSTEPGNPVELAERLETSNESARAFAGCLDTQGTSRQADLSMIEAAKYMYTNLLEKANEALPQQLEDLQADATRQTQMSPFRDIERAPVPSLRDIKQETLPLPQRRWEQRENCFVLVLRPSVLRADRRNKLRTTIFASNLGNLHLIYRTGEWKYEFKTSTLTTRILIFLLDKAEQKGRARDFYTYVGPGSDGSSADKLSLNLKFNPQNTAISLRAATDEKDSLYAIQHVRILAFRTEQRSAR